jgi:hypothetical protein
MGTWDARKGARRSPGNIRRVRQRRGDVRQQLQEIRDASGDPSVITWIRVSVALDGLDQAADQAAAEFG